MCVYAILSRAFFFFITGSVFLSLFGGYLSQILVAISRAVSGSILKASRWSLAPRLCLFNNESNSISALLQFSTQRQKETSQEFIERYQSLLCSLQRLSGCLVVLPTFTIPGLSLVRSMYMYPLIAFTLNAYGNGRPVGRSGDRRERIARTCSVSLLPLIAAIFARLVFSNFSGEPGS